MTAAWCEMVPIGADARAVPLGANWCEPSIRTNGTPGAKNGVGVLSPWGRGTNTISPEPRLAAWNQLNPWLQATQLAVDRALPSERRLLGLLDACGAMDAPNLARAAERPLSLVIETLRRLRAADLTTYRRPYWHLAPRVVRWANELEPAR
jgi:hypothetical protein